MLRCKLNSKDYLVPQSRQRILILGMDNRFKGARPIPRPLRPFGHIDLWDILEFDLPHTDLQSISTQQQNNVHDYTEILKAEIAKGGQ